MCHRPICGGQFRNRVVRGGISGKESVMTMKKASWETLLKLVCCQVKEDSRTRRTGSSGQRRQLREKVGGLPIGGGKYMRLFFFKCT